MFSKIIPPRLQKHKPNLRKKEKRPPQEVKGFARERNSPRTGAGKTRADPAHAPTLPLRRHAPPAPTQPLRRNIPPAPTQPRADPPPVQPGERFFC